jgi:soluble lytic murein transglycosylase-like protein
MGAFALTLVNFAAVGAPQQAAAPVRPPALAAAPATPIPMEPSRAAGAPRPVEAAPPVPSPPPPPPPTPAPKAEAPVSATANAAPEPNDEMERLKKAADLLVKVNEALGTPRSPYGKVIYDIAIRHSINPHLVAALIHVESAFNARAVSPKGAYGLMQLLPETARRFGVTRKKDLFNPKKNLEAGVRYLKWLADRFGGDAEKILAAYNAGEGAVERFGGIPPYQETQSYVQKIFELLGVTLPSPPPPPAAEVDGQEAAGR